MLVATSALARALAARAAWMQSPKAHCWTPATAILTIGFIFVLRLTERTVELAQHRPALQPASAPSFSSRPAPATPVSMPSAACSAERMRTLPLYARPLPADEVRLLWRPAVGEWLAMHVPGPLPDAAAAAPRLRGCPMGCGGEGTCNHALGICECSSGRRGAACEAEERWECNAADGRYMWSRCAGECDTRYGYCYCGRRGAFPHRPLLQCEPVGIEKVVRPWRVDGRNAGERKPWAAIWGGGGAGGGKASGSREGVEMAWCDATQGAKPRAHCACRCDGYLCTASTTTASSG